MQIMASMSDRDYMAIKHGIKIERHNFPQEWKRLEPYYEFIGGYQQGKGGRGGYHPQFPPGAPVGLTSLWTQPDPSK